MQSDLGDTYRIRLRSLQWASSLVHELRLSRDADAVSVATHWALDAVYDLFEIYQLAAPSNQRQDAWLEKASGQTIGGLIFIRGEKTHRAAKVDAPNPFKELPYDFAKLTDWTWGKASTARPDMELRLEWYLRYVKDRPLWVPLDHAWHWFLTRSPIDIPGQDARTVPGWVEGVRPILE